MIRQAEERDVADILRIYEAARSFMRRSGNLAQWTGGYPSEEIVHTDISRGVSYVLENEAGHLHAVFALIPGDDPTYAHIEGAWQDTSPYATIHRAGSDSTVRGTFRTILAAGTITCVPIRMQTTNPCRTAWKKADSLTAALSILQTARRAAPTSGALHTARQTIR